MKKLEKSVPVIRFKGFSDAWEQRKLGELGEVTTGKAFSSTSFDNQGEYLVITNKNISDSSRSQNIITNRISISDDEIIQRYRLDGENILVTMDGVNLGKTAMYSNANALLAQRVGRIKSNQLEFIYQITSSNTFLRTMQTLSVGNAIKHISLKQISEYSSLGPKDIIERKKIGSFFKKLDNAIALHQRKLNALKLMKKGFLQQMFPKSEEDVPKIRFTDFNGNWRQCKLEEVADRVRGNDRRMELPTLTISASKGWLNQHERFFGNIAGKEQKNYTLLKKGQLSYNHGNSKSAKYGSVFVLRTYDEALVPRIYHSFKTNILANSDFIEYLFATKIPDRELGKIVSSGARMDGLLNINFNDFMSILIMLPFVEEQIKISNFLIRLDKIISLYQNKLDQLIKLKKAYLQYLFI
ncbi:restriction endonuclease subunit S [Listeria monocytogenes]|nr:restriction endonuclease subunit S [Listeria monocytogenes]